MRVFIDANTYIKLFTGRPSQDYFEKLEKLLSEKKFTLFFPKITQEEVYRNVWQILKKEAEEQKLIFPKIHDIFDDEKIINKLKELESEYKKVWHTEYKRQLEIKKTMAKKLFSEFKKLTIDFDDLNGENFKLASERKNKRFSPGKNTDPIGDQLAWEIILKNCLDQDLIIVSADGDWSNKITGEQGEINPFLLEEWQSKTSNKNIELAENLGVLIQKYEKDFKISREEIDKDKQKPFYYEYPYFLNPQNLGTPPFVSEQSMGAHPLTGPTGPVNIIVANPTNASGTSLSNADFESIANLSRKCPECSSYIAIGQYMTTCPKCGASLE